MAGGDRAVHHAVISADPKRPMPVQPTSESSPFSQLPERGRRTTLANARAHEADPPQVLPRARPRSSRSPSSRDRRHLLGAHLARPSTALRGADRRWLGSPPSASRRRSRAPSAPGALRSRRRAAGSARAQAAARLGVGSLVNTFAPARLGDAVKVALCSRASTRPERLWTAGGVYAALGAARCAGARVAGGGRRRRPARCRWWPVLVLCGVRRAARSRRRALRRGCAPPKRLAQFVDGLAALERSPRALARCSAGHSAWPLARLGATTAVGGVARHPASAPRRARDPAGARRRRGVPDHARRRRHRRAARSPSRSRAAASA